MFYVLDENHNLKEALDKEGVLALLETAIENGDLESVVNDSAFVDKLKCSVSGGTFHVAFITQAKYNELLADNQLIADCIYYITDDTTCDDIDAALQTINEAISDNENSIVNLNTRVEALEVAKKLEVNNISLTSDQPIGLGIYLPEGKTENNIVGFKLNAQYGLNNVYFEAFYKSGTLGLTSIYYQGNDSLQIQATDIEISIESTTREIKFASLESRALRIMTVSSSETTFATKTLSNIKNLVIYIN